MQHTSPRRTAATVLIVGVDPQDAGQIRESLGTDAAIPNEDIAHSQGADAVRRFRPAVVVVGFDADPGAAIALGSALKAEHPQLAMIAHGRGANPENIRSAMRAGYRDFVVLPEDTDLLRRAVREAPTETVMATEQGQVIAIIGAKGGVGTTFIAVNLGAELAPIHRVCTVDLDFSMGDVAGMLDMQPPSHLHDLISNLSRLDERMLAGSVGVHPSGLHILPQPIELVENDFLRGEDILKILSVAADAYQYLLVDCGGRLDEATRTAAAVADLIFLVCSPDVPSVKNAWRRLHLLDRQGVDLGRVRLIVNRLDKNPPLSEADIESNLGIPIAATIANDPGRCQHAVNVGTLLRDVDRRSTAARDISNLVSLITEDIEQVIAPVRTPLSWLFR